MLGLPEWAAGALFTATLGLTTGLLMLGVRRTLARRQEAGARTSDRVDSLLDLSAMLQESEAFFQDQNYKARELLKRTRANHHGVVAEGLGFDETFHRLHPQFTDDERELFDLIRSMTKVALFGVNRRMKDWLEDSPEFLVDRSDAFSALSGELARLQEHLGLWLAKYDVFLQQETRSLVYLGDEKQHGAAFPSALEPELRRVLEDLEG